MALTCKQNILLF